MDKPNFDENLVADVSVPEGSFAAANIEKGRKSNSLNDLLLQGTTGNKYSAGKKRGQYAKVESKVKGYIESLPAPKSRGKMFKKHTSMPSYLGDNVNEFSSSSQTQLEQDFYFYKRQSEHTISELQQQINVAVRLIGDANEENYQLLDQIERLQRPRAPSPPTICQEVQAISFVGTPKKEHNSYNHPNIGSFLDQHDIQRNELPVVADVIVATDVSVLAKRNLSFNSSEEFARSAGGTDSGINTSDGNDIPDTAEANLQKKVLEVSNRSCDCRSRKRIWTYISAIFCCRTPAGQGTSEWQFFYKKM